MPKSKYGAEVPKNQKFPVVHTVGQLLKVLNTLPNDLPLQEVGVPGDAKEGLRPHWCNVGTANEAVLLEPEQDPNWGK